MSQFNLSGSSIQDTYPRLVQVGDGQLLDGTGSSLPIHISGEDVRIVGELKVDRLVISGSSTEIFASGSTKFGDDGDDTHQFTGSLHLAQPIKRGNLTGSDEWDSAYSWGDHSTENYVSESTGNVSITSLTASTHISASTIYATDLRVTGSAQLKGTLIFAGVTFSDTIIQSHTGSHNWGNAITDKHEFTGSVYVSNSLYINDINVEDNLVPTFAAAADDQILTYSASAISWKDAPVSIDTSSIGTLLPSADISNNLGASDKKWKDLYAQNTYFGGIHEINLETKDIQHLPIGTILVHSITGLIPCNSLADPLVMGVSNAKADYPIVMGAEPILIDGSINIGDFIITSDVIGHGKAISPDELSQVNLHGRVIAQALESSDGGLVNAMIRKM